MPCSRSRSVRAIRGRANEVNRSIQRNGAILRDIIGSRGRPNAGQFYHTDMTLASKGARRKEVSLPLKLDNSLSGEIPKVYIF